ncbi:MAG: phosphatase PAP2 family protein, partial [Clostridia bacterium]|nr:phosphatase PAP2 family protein [Clostridia bacterium]
DNLLTRFMAEFYRFDTNTNVCPSIHVIGSIGIWAAGWNAPKLQKIRWKAGFTGVTILICLSTVFLKQHSVIDVMAALPICAAAYLICYRKTPRNTDNKRSLRSKLSKEKQYIL